MATSSLGPDAVAAYRRMESAFGELRAAHDLVRLNHSRFAYAGCEDPSAHGRELKHLVTRAERASFEYRLAVREYVDHMCTQQRSGVGRTVRTARTPQLWGSAETSTTTPLPERRPARAQR